MTKKCICRELNLLNPTEFYGHFVFTTLEPGEGITLGNMIRRTLLSKLAGSKIVGVKFSNINHEFSEVEGIREDLLEIFLNLKEVIIKNPLNFNICYGKLKVEGPAIVTAGFIQLPKDLMILNPQHYLFTISEQICVEFEVKIEHGKSYILATDRKLNNFGDFLPLDANFTPILNVEYYIQPIVEYIEKSNEELHMIISTNGTLLPHEALLLATNNLSKLILGCRNIESIYPKKKLFTTKINKSKLEDQFVEKNLKKGKIKENNFEEFLFSTSIDEEKLEHSSKNTMLASSKIKVQEKLKKTSPLSINLKHKNNKNLQLNAQSSGKNVKLPASERKQKENSFFKNQNETLTEKIKDSNIIQTSTKTLDLRNIDIEITCLPTRIITALRKANINVMADLLKNSSYDLEKIKGLGPVSITKIKTQVDLFFEAISL